MSERLRLDWALARRDGNFREQRRVFLLLLCTLRLRCALPREIVAMIVDFTRTVRTDCPDCKTDPRCKDGKALEVCHKAHRRYPVCAICRVGSKFCWSHSRTDPLYDGNGKRFAYCHRCHGEICNQCGVFRPHVCTWGDEEDDRDAVAGGPCRCSGGVCRCGLEENQLCLRCLVEGKELKPSS